MKKAMVGLALLLCLPLVGSGQSINYYPAGGPPTTTGGSSFFAGGISLGNTVASPYANLFGNAANTLALRNGGTAGVPVPQTFDVYNFCDGAACATGYERTSLYWSGNNAYLALQKGGTGSLRDLYLSPGANRAVYLENANLRPTGSDSNDIGAATILWRRVYLAQSIQGSKSKTLVDNTATAFVRLSVADDDYEGCEVIYTAFAEDTATDERQTRTGKVAVAILNNSGTEAAVFSTGDSAVAVTAGTFTCTFDGNSASANTIDLRATCDTSLAATTTLTFEYRLDCPSALTVTPQ
jgi:hypothetical protein